MDLDLRDLRYFQSIAEFGHLGRAAEHLGRSQPALTKCIRRLETRLAAPLFERKGRGIRLTPVGELLLAQTRRLRGAVDAGLEEVLAFAQGRSGRVRLGCGPITAENILPSVCDLILSRAAGITLELKIGMNYDLREQLRRGELDILIGLIREQDADEYVVHPMIEDIVVVAAAEGHPVFSIPDLAIEDLLQFDWVLPIAQVESRKWLDRAFASRGLPLPRAHIETNSIPMLPGALAAAEFLYFVSHHTLARRASEGLREVRLEATTLRRRLGIIYARSHLVPAVSRTIELLREELASAVTVSDEAKPA
jgi:DNA-binding transcriptional LysR family regulator